jgi:hypothetical protein
VVSIFKGSNPRDKTFSKTLTDVAKEVYIEEWSVSAEELGKGSGWSIEKHRLHGGVSDGVDIVTVNNGKLSFVVVPTRGMGIWKGEHQGNFLGWDSPVKHLVHPRCINLEARGGRGWLDGFNEWVVRCGLASFGSPGVDTAKDATGNPISNMLTLHGRVANIPASTVKVKIGSKPPFEISVEGTVHESSMFGPSLKLTSTITTVPGANFLKISDTIQNMRGFPDEMQILYHCNYGSPFLEKDAHLVAPISCVAPRDFVASKGIDDFSVFGAPEAGYSEQVFYMKPLSDVDGLAKAMLVAKDEAKAVSVSFHVKELPCLTLWKNIGALEDGYVVGLEPGTSYPNPKPFERVTGRVIKLGPGEKYNVNVTLSVHLGKDEVCKAAEELSKIQKQKKPTIYRNPAKSFSPI